MVFKDLWILLFIPLVLIAGFFVKKMRPSASIRFSSGKLLKQAEATWKIFLAEHLIYLRLAILVLFLLALARPRIPLEETKVETEGIDIVLTIDCSGSMLAEDFTIAGRRVNRLAVAKDVVKDFIKGRKSDRIGLVAFAARAYTVCPLTLDYDWLLQNLERVEIGAIEDGTAVGSALSSSLNRLKDTNAKTRIVVFLSDGVNNAGTISPLTAAEAAKALGIKVYTIGAGKKGPVPYPARDIWGRKVYQNVEIDIDEDTLRTIARQTNAKYFRATDTESLRKIYAEIDSLEKTPVAEKGYQEYKELFHLFLIAGLLLLVLEITLSHTVLRKLP